MTHFLHTDADLQAGLAQLILADPRLKPVAEKAGAFALRRREAGFPGLCAIVCGQQLSTASAAAIRARLFAAFDPFHHDAVLKARTDKLKRLGLSDAKIKSIREIGKAVAKGQIDLTHVGEMDADDAHAALTALHGVGPWTADIYLLFCLGHADAFPAGDLAVQESGAHRLQLAQAARRQGAHQIGRSLAALARRGGASVVGLLSRGEAARGRVARAGRESEEAREEEEEDSEENRKKKTARRPRRRHQRKGNV